MGGSVIRHHRHASHRAEASPRKPFVFARTAPPHALRAVAAATAWLVTVTALAAGPAQADTVTVLEADALAQDAASDETRLVVDTAELADLPPGSEVFDDPGLDDLGMAVVDVPAHAAGQVKGTPPAPVTAAVVPDDPDYGRQAALADLNLPQAWDRATGDAGIVVAVLDSGVWSSHVDLGGKLWRNPGERCGDGRDDDGNGRVDDCAGWDFVNGDGDPSDDDGHGTRVAGQIAAATNNGTGVAGVAWESTILPVKVLDERGNGNSVTVAQGIKYAIDHGADVINLSLGGPRLNPELARALDAAEAAGVLVVAAAGNSGSAVEHYPAAHPTTLAVAASELGLDTLEYYSSYGPWVDVAAPGTAYTTSFDPFTGRAGYRTDEGTSMAAPLVAGGAALVLALDPGLDSRALRASARAAAAARPVSGVASGLLDLRRWLDVAVDPDREPAQRPRLGDDQAEADGAEVVADVLANDRAPAGHALDSATLAVVEPPAHGTAVPLRGRLAVLPAVGYTGTDTLRYEICTTSGGCGTATLRIDVTAPVPAPDEPPPGSGAGSDEGRIGGPAVDPPLTAPHSGDTAIQAACPNGRVRAAAFEDVEGAHAGAIHCLVAYEIADGMTPTRFAPGSTVTRGQMATFLAELVSRGGVELPAPASGFRDLEGVVHAEAIERLAAAGLVDGKTADRFDPRSPVTRAQMASFLVGALEEVGGAPLPDGPSVFADVGGSVHGAAIHKLAAAGVTTGVREGAFAPTRTLVRAQMASFVARSLDRLVRENRIAPRTV